MTYSQQTPEERGLKRGRDSSERSPTPGSQKKTPKTDGSKAFSSSKLLRSNLLERLSPAPSANPIQGEVPKYKDAEVGINPPSTDVQMGESTDSHRDPSTRMLDRVGRLLHAKIPQRKSDKTPHLASVKLGKDIYIAGNSGKKNVSLANSTTAEEKMLEITAPEAKQKSQKGNQWIRQDISKLSALREGRYHSEEDQSGDLSEIKQAIENNSMIWSQLNQPESSNGSKHGEMALHEPILKYANENRQSGDKKKDIYVGGVQKDCLFCHWSHAILNKYVYADLGHEVMTSGTHGNVFPGWIAPQELLQNQEALAAFNEKLKTLDNTDKGVYWSMDNDGKVNCNGDYQKVEGNLQYPYGSDSE
ncbi:hypothetical protein [Nostoc sp.]|uniref:hypothetical protein n=1 Tax=Nostoc sp. TaxID=1180 RepID=UPI002FFD3936